MAKITRKNFKPFGASGTTGKFGQFGSQAASSPVTSKDPDTIQGLGAWDTGWEDAVTLGKAPYLQDDNGVKLVFGYMIANIYQDGIPEWETGTTYFIGSIVRKVSTFELYGSLVDTNVGNALPSKVTNANWKYLGDLLYGDPLTMSSVVLDTGNGHGSSSTCIRRFTNNTVVGTGITYADSATLGASLTIVRAGLYYMSYSDAQSASKWACGVSKNAAGGSLTTAIQSVTLANGKLAVTYGEADSVGHVSVLSYLSAGDVIRPHTNGTVNRTDDNVIFVIQQVR